MHEFRLTPISAERLELTNFSLETRKTLGFLHFGNESVSRLFCSFAISRVPRLHRSLARKGGLPGFLMLFTATSLK